MDQKIMPHFKGRTDLDKLFGSVTYCPRPSFLSNRWLPDAAELNADSGRELLLARKTHVICSRGSSTPEALQLLTDAGFSIPENIIHFSTQQEYTEILSKLAGNGDKVVVNHPLKSSDLTPENYWIPKEFFQALNNSKNLDRLAPAEIIPHRKIMEMTELKDLIKWMEGSAIFKVATDESTCNGHGIAIAKTTLQLADALAKLDGTDEVIVEEYLETTATYTLNFMLSHNGSIMYSGAAERNIDDSSGNHNGFWLEAEPSLPPIAMNIGIMIASNCIEMGYHGFLNIDIGILPDNQIRLFDITFRANSTTTALNFHTNILRQKNASTLLLRSWCGKSDYQQLLKTAYNLLEKNQFLPLWSYDPRADGIEHAQPRIGGLIIGNSRKEIALINEHNALF